LSADTEQRYNIKNVVGAIVHSCGAFWPYRLITRIWEQLLTQHQAGISIETNTPVTAIAYSPETDSKFPYELNTPRGVIRAANVIHATNGYTGHLLPGLRGKIYPFRGTMSTQQATHFFGQHGTERAWSFSFPPRIDAETGVIETGLYYSNQNPKTGDIFIGGEKTPFNEIIVSDDSVVHEIAKENISTVLPRYFDKGWSESEQPHVRKVWSGIMGFTADHLPLVGKLPTSLTRRGGSEEGSEWICAGFNGYGMPQCWSAGEAVAKMMLGEDVSDFLPDSYLATEERLSRMTPEAALQRLLGV
jgi:glycine/D-amino acid oxidase-like deaminating enzyme